MVFKKAIIKKITKYFSLLTMFSLIAIILLDLFISFYVRNQIYTNIEKLPYRPYGMVLGTSKYFLDNSLNLFYYNRLLASYDLFASQKIDYLLLSGDNRTLAYNEPRNMNRDLLKMGIPQAFMYFDFAGFRTLDSVIRANQVFHAHSLTIISQKFHCERALFIAKFHNIDAICYVADYPEGHYFVRFREYFARLQTIWDLFTGKAPHFLGDPEPLPTPIPQIESIIIDK